MSKQVVLITGAAKAKTEAYRPKTPPGLRVKAGQSPKGALRTGSLLWPKRGLHSRPDVSE